MPSQTKRATTSLHHGSCLVLTEGANLSNRQASGQEPKEWQERWDNSPYETPVSSYTVESGTGMYLILLSGERPAQPCLQQGPRAGASHPWDANGMLQPP